jgi:hypothetical protein
MVCVAICRGKWEPPSSLVDGLPPDVDAWFERALHPDATQRFASCKEMALAFMQHAPKEKEIEDTDSWTQSGEFSLPPPSSPELTPVGKLPPLGDEALLGEAVPSSKGGRGPADRTPTFSGAAAELAPAAAQKRNWRRKAVGAIGAVTLLAAGVIGGVLVTSGVRSDGESAAPGSEPEAASASPATEDSPDLADLPVDTQTDPGTDLQPAPDASTTADAGPRPRYWRPRSYPYERSKRPKKDLGF